MHVQVVAAAMRRQVQAGLGMAGVEEGAGREQGRHTTRRRKTGEGKPHVLFSACVCNACVCTETCLLMGQHCNIITETVVPTRPTTGGQVGPVRLFLDMHTDLYPDV